MTPRTYIISIDQDGEARAIGDITDALPPSHALKLTPIEVIQIGAAKVSIPAYVARCAGTDHAESAHDLLAEAAHRAMDSGEHQLIIITPERHS